MIGRVLCTTVAVVLLLNPAGFARHNHAGYSGTVTPTAALAAVSGQNTVGRTGSSPVANSRPALSLADLIGIFLFLTLIGAHFFMCRKGIYPESSCLCEPPPWLRRLITRARRKADS